MRLQTDPGLIKELALECEGRNWRFRLFLEGIDLNMEELDFLVHKHMSSKKAGKCMRKTIHGVNIQRNNFVIKRIMGTQ
ncbi:MAG: hypothetical protein KAR40_18405 [Candidatus Sabulitectum sp.]|nr:hypothetical protein [Candidatus Sabulitectum sp.]